jgi:hypothetical protein
MLKPPGHGDPTMQGVMANEVNDRMANAVEDLKKHYGSGGSGLSSNNANEVGPSGAAYHEQEKAKKEEKKAKKAIEAARAAQDAADEEYRKFCNVDSDDEEGADDDVELRGLRDARLKEMKRKEMQKLEHIGKGHGQFRDILEDEFLKEVTGSERVVCHFYHNDFERCKIMDMHLNKLAKRHIETKFIKIDAAKAPFFVNKLSIRTMPTLVQFIDGICRGKQVGFEGLADEMPEGKEDEWPTILLARILAKNTMIDKENVVDEDGMKLKATQQMQDLRKANFFHIDDDELELSD